MIASKHSNPACFAWNCCRVDKRRNALGVETIMPLIEIFAEGELLCWEYVEQIVSLALD